MCVGFFLLAQNVMAQFGAGSKIVKSIAATELLVVLDPVYGDEYNDGIQAAIKTYWTFTKYRFISGPQYKMYCKDKKYSFLCRFEVKDAALTDEKFDNLGVIQGGNCGQDIGDFAAYANLMVFSPKAYPTECIRAVQLLQNYLVLATENPVSNLKNWEEVMALHNHNKRELPDKQLLLQLADCLEKYQDIRNIRNTYTRPVRFAEYDEIDAAIVAQNPDIIYHRLVFDSEGYRFHTFFCAKDNKILFMKQGQGSERVLLGKTNLAELMQTGP